MGSESENSGKHDKFSNTVGDKAKRKLAHQKEGGFSAGSAVRTMGIVGWSIVIPTLLGIYCGRWLDHTYVTSYSWTLTLLLAGLILGCYNAYYWIKKEDKWNTERDTDDDHNP